MRPEDEIELQLVAAKDRGGMHRLRFMERHTYRDKGGERIECVEVGVGDVLRTCWSQKYFLFRFGFYESGSDNTLIIPFSNFVSIEPAPESGYEDHRREVATTGIHP